MSQTLANTEMHPSHQHPLQLSGRCTDKPLPVPATQTLGPHGERFLSHPGQAAPALQTS